ncbi:MAG: hypothetical protein IJD31_06020 [Lachnospiraceae bacterium]|nr:hypothetical protein [Lachnospiraceae bacterium]
MKGFRIISHTEEEMVSDSNGEAKFREFHGEYGISVDGKTFNVNSSKKETTRFFLRCNYEF